MSDDRLAYFERIVRDDPSVARARFAYANELLHAGRDADAVEQLRAYLDLAEDEGNGWQRLGRALARLGRRDEAADAFLSGIEQAGKHGHGGMAEEMSDELNAL